MNKDNDSVLSKLSTALEKLKVPPPTNPRKRIVRKGQSAMESVQSSGAAGEQETIFLARRKSLDDILGMNIIVLYEEENLI